MNSTIKKLLSQLILTDCNTSDFLELSKKIADAVKLAQKEKAEKPPKPHKIPKPKVPNVKLCDECSFLLMKNLDLILPSEN
jgi:hypothetical protein